MTGLVLTGGRSVRFGTDKGRFVLPGETQDMLQRTLCLLGSLPGIRRLAVSCRADQAAALRPRLPAGTAVVEDPPHETSTPFYGVLSALRSFGGPLLVLSCDLPLMDKDTLVLLIEARSRTLASAKSKDDAPLRTTFMHPDGRAETLVSVYEAEALPFFEETLRAGRQGLFSAIPFERQTFLPCPAERPFLNMNTPDGPAMQEYLRRMR